MDSKVIYFTLNTMTVTTIARHFVSHNMTSDPEFTLHMLEYIRIPKMYKGHIQSGILGE